ncbi:MAG: CPBP family intramembrane metalloprotease [bacterium]|nr:CPBP family intramembrane metalloprotease [bacterium]
MQTDNTVNTPGNDHLVSFFILAFLFSWLMWLPALLLTYEVVAAGGLLSRINGIAQWLGGIGPSFAAFFLVLKYEGKKGGKELLRRGFRFRLGKWYIPVLLLMPLLVISAHVLNTFKGGTFPERQILSEPWFIPLLFPVFYIMQLGEEFGWRGFALDRMQNRWNALISSVVLGIIWGLWHLPMFLAKGFGHHDNHLPFGQLMITLVLASVLITWFQNNTGGSLIAAFITHTYINLSSEVLPLIEANTEFQGDYTPWIIVNILLIAATTVALFIWGPRTLTGRKGRVTKRF